MSSSLTVGCRALYTRAQVRRADRAQWAWAVAALIGVALIAVKMYYPPLWDSALFEYYGRAILHGKLLYRDFFDTKMPSIYYTNAFLQAVFGSHYSVHAVFEALIALTSIFIFAICLKSDGVRLWGVGTFVFAAAFVLMTITEDGPSFNVTEDYALFWLLIGLRASQMKAPLLAGALVGVATTFWIPSVAFVLALAVRYEDRAKRIALLLGTLGFLFGLGLVMLRYFGAAPLRELVGYWGLYERMHTLDAGLTLHGLASKAYHQVVLSPIGCLVLALVWGFRRPWNTITRFGLVWVLVALLGALINFRFWTHYFIVSTAALAYAAVIFLPSTKAPTVRAVMAITSVVILINVLSGIPQNFQRTAIEWSHVEATAKVIQANVPVGGHIHTYGSQPGIYLAADRDSAGKYLHTFIPSVKDPTSDLRLSKDLLGSILHSDAVVALRSFENDAPVADIFQRDFIEICAVGSSTWRVFEKRSKLKGRRSHLRGLGC